MSRAWRCHGVVLVALAAGSSTVPPSSCAVQCMVSTSTSAMRDGEMDARRDVRKQPCAPEGTPYA